MSKKIKKLEDITKVYEELQEKLENIDENTDLGKLVKELKKMQKDLDIEE